MLPFHLERNSQIVLFPCSLRNALSLLLCSFWMISVSIKRRWSHLQYLKMYYPVFSPWPARRGIWIYEAWCDYKRIDLNDRKALALTPSPLPACTCLCPGRKNSHLERLGIEIHARFVRWAAEMLHCSIADSIAPSELQYCWPVATPGYRRHVACSALEKEIGIDHPGHSLDGLWEYW